MTTTTLGNINSENKQVTERPVPPEEASFTGQRGFRRIAVVGAAVLLGCAGRGFRAAIITAQTSRFRYESVGSTNRIGSFANYWCASRWTHASS